jgi:general secretion pathway protein J
MAAGRNKVNSKLSTVHERGFTLVELLIAIFIFAIVVSVVYGSYRATFHIVHGSEYRLHIANSARIVLERVAEDLGSIVTGPGGVFSGEMHDYSGKRGDSLSFVSNAHLVLRKTDTRSGPVLIRYQVELDEETGLLNLYRSDIVLLPGTEIDDDDDDDDARKHLICRGLQEIQFTYFDQDGNETEEWQVEELVSSGEGAATEKSPFPSLVYVELRFAESVESDVSTVFKTAVVLQ